MDRFSQNFQQVPKETNITVSSPVWDALDSNININFMDIQQDDFQEESLNGVEIAILFYNTIKPMSLELFSSFATKIQSHNKKCDIQNLNSKIRKIIIIGTKADQDLVVDDNDLNLKKEMIYTKTDMTPDHFRMSAHNPNPSTNDYCSFNEFNDFLEKQIEQLKQEKLQNLEELEEKKSKLTQENEYANDKHHKKKYDSRISTLSHEDHLSDDPHNSSISSISSGMQSTMDQTEHHHNKISIMTTIEEKQHNSIGSTSSSDMSTHSLNTKDQTQNTLTTEDTHELTLSKEINNTMTQYVDLIRRDDNQLLPRDLQQKCNCFSYCCYYFCWGSFWSGLSSGIFTICGIIAGALDKYSAIKGFHIPENIFHVSFAHWSPVWRAALMGAAGGGIIGVSAYTIYLTCKCLCCRRCKDDHERDVVHDEQHDHDKFTIPIIKGRLSPL